MRFSKWLLILIAAMSLMAAPQGSKKKAATPSKSAPAASSATQSGSLLDINTASEQELKQLPGIGDAYSAKIIAGRPYRAKNQLVQKKIIPQATYDKIKDMIIAKQASTDKKK